MNGHSAHVSNTCAGNLAGHAWTEGFGWIDFADAVIDGNGYIQGRAVDDR